MKNLFKLLSISLFLFVATACNDLDETPNLYVEVDDYNLSGTWQLVEWNGEPLVDGVYSYITFINNKDTKRTFVMYHNLDSAKAREIDGIYRLENEDEDVIISGRYAHDSGDWSSEYYITEMTANRMVWTVTDNPSDVSVYEKRTKVPDEIVIGQQSIELER